MQKVELQTEIEFLHSKNEVLQEIVSTLEHALIIGVEQCGQRDDIAAGGRHKR